MWGAGWEQRANKRQWGGQREGAGPRHPLAALRQVQTCNTPHCRPRNTQRLPRAGSLGKARLTRKPSHYASRLTFTATVTGWLQTACRSAHSSLASMSVKPASKTAGVVLYAAVKVHVRVVGE